MTTINGLPAQSAPAPATAPAGSTSDASKDSDVVVMEPFEVVGSHIKRVDTETPSPVIELKAVDLQNIGLPTIGDVIRALPFNSGQALSPTDSGNSFSPGVNAINLRGLGNNETLVLINGRRAVPFATPGFNGLQTVFDFNSLPEAAIEKIEILKDGGSALYGSDAVGGVINVQLRQDYEGVSTSAEVGNFYHTNGLLKKGSVVVGTHSGNTSIVSTFDWAEQHAVFARDVKWAADANKTSVASKAGARYTVTGWENVQSAPGPFTSEQDYLDKTNPLIGFTNAIDDGWFDARSSRGFPGYVTVDDGEGGTVKMTYDAPTNTPTAGAAVPGNNPYNFQETAGLFPEYRTFGFYTHLKHDFNPDLYGFAELSFHRYTTQADAAATPVDIENEHGLDSADPMVLPSYNPFNPFGQDITNGRRRLVELPNRINDVTADTPRVLVGMGGNLPTLDGWKWESAVLYNRNSVTNLNKGSVADAGMQQALMGLTRLGDGSLVWDPTTPQSDRVYFNWFGLNEPAMAKFLSIDNPTSDSLEYWTYDVSGSGRVFDLPAGQVTLAVGAEHNSQKLESVRTYLNATGGIVGGAEASSAFGQRSVTSVYAELSVPVLKQLEFQLAARYENYSDKGFESKARPKIGFKYRPTDWLILRGSFSQSFKAPDLAYLYTSGSTSFSEVQTQDPITHTRIDQVQSVSGGDPTLRPELTDTYYAGAVFEAPRNGMFKGLELSVDYLEFRQKDALSLLSDFYSYADFLQGAANNDPLFANKVVRDPNTNELLYILDNFSNISSTRSRWLDYGLNYRRTTDSMGTFDVGLQATFISTYILDGGQIAGHYLTPRWNGTGTVGWSKGDWGFHVTEIVKGGSRNDTSFGTVYDEGDTLYLTYDMKPQFITNVGVTFRGFGRTEITVGANNLFNQTPPVDPLQQIGTTPGVNYAEPGFWYVRLGHDF